MKVAAALFLLTVLVGLFFLFRDGEVGSDEAQSDSGVSREAQGETNSGGAGAEEWRFIQGNPFIEDYGREGGSIEADLATLRDVLRDCQLLLKDFDRYHLPGNPEIVAFLQGENPDGLAWIPREHPLVNSEGELEDRHGTPVFFHRLSGMRFEYRSAGPDRRHWTDDDVVLK